MRIMVKVIERTRDGFPTEWAGVTDDGARFSALFSYGHLVVFLDRQLFVSWTLSHSDRDGVLQDEDLVEVLDGLVEFPDSFLEG